VHVTTSDLPELRASHADRDRAVETLRIAGGDGRLTAEELEGRLEAALSARTVAELTELTADLPAGPAAKDLLVVKQHGSQYLRTGRWVVPKRIERAGADPRLRIELAGTLLHAKVIERWPRRGAADQALTT
jgi:hypothetical protein